MTDPGMFEAFVREYQDMVYAVAVRLLGNPVEAEDIAQTAFMKAYERFDAISASPAAAGWLKTVTTNLCLNHLSRYRSRWRFFSELPRDDAEEATPFELTIPASAPDASARDAADQQDALERALQGLPDHQRVPLVLFHFEDKTYQEIAELLRISLAKVKTDIHRGRAVLKAVLTRPHGSD
jgi:RNA polymerase sigma-70 factor (ECF subfamily)